MERLRVPVLKMKGLEMDNKDQIQLLLLTTAEALSELSVLWVDLKAHSTKDLSKSSRVQFREKAENLNNNILELNQTISDLMGRVEKTIFKPKFRKSLKTLSEVIPELQHAMLFELGTKIRKKQIFLRS